MPATLDDIMENASAALVKMDYLGCESLCLEALARARRERGWAYYTRILLPLQEARRQRRMIAAEGVIRLGTATLTGAPADWLRETPSGATVVTHPHTADTARALDELARAQRLHVEVLFADSDAAATWRLRSFRGPAVTREVPAPPPEWRDRWIKPGKTTPGNARTPADWFIDATEALGDAALVCIDGKTLAPEQRLEALEACLEVVTDHEIIHQRLGDAARSLSLGTPPIPENGA
ncbi:MAG: hypothetical protein K8S99_03980 [Planctomycetes bacterium]|nr:hypothetical protein [Planctomycetota bacterium]